MSLSEQDLTLHCQRILEQSRIRNKLVLLCEGSIEHFKAQRFSPHSYKQLDQLPDCNFYKACIPQDYSPNFFQCFPCGSIDSVLRAYFKLKELHDQNPKNSWLNPDKLFVLVDLDIQIRKIDNYLFSDTEEIFYDLYQENKLNIENSANHRIFVTGLIHKEAYFFIPELQETFDNWIHPPIFENKPLNLQIIYQKIAERLGEDKDLENSFQRVIKRITYCRLLDTNSINTLQNTILNNLGNSQVINALLTIAKSKPYWEKHIQFSTYGSNSEKIFRDQLLLEIARFYKHQSEESALHISALIRTLHQHS